jgi:hypothetical protein
MFDVHQPDGFGNAPGFVFIVFGWFPCFDGAKRTRAGTSIAEDHKGGSAFTPAFAHIGAVAALANGVQLVAIYKGSHFFIFFAYGQFDP